MKILTISDQVEPVLYDRFDHRQFEGIDLILSCGDLPPEYLSFLLSKLNAPLYCEMLREIIAFVLMNVSAKKEIRLVDELFDLSEVKEIHSVHGSVDVIAKIVLKRSLLSSDAETIGDFVHNRIRQIPGILSTQTLIPGYSKQKKNR